jgi:hypothetical protein
MLFFVVCGMMLRPHGDTFTALDHSGYRLMAYAFSQGRDVHETDHMLAELPEELRQGVMLLPHMMERNTRDRSFLVHALEYPETEPFFYPTLPWLAAAVARVAGSWAMDLVMPLMGIASFFLLAWLARRYTSGLLPAVAVAAVCWLGGPLFLWTFRGFYAEAAGVLPLFLALALWLGPKRLPVVRAALSGLLLSVAICFHPVYVSISLPLLLCMVLDPELRLRASALACTGFGIGLGVFVWMTNRIASPYGPLSLEHMGNHVAANESYRIPVLIAATTLCAAIPLFVLRDRWRPWLTRAASCLPGRLAFSLLALSPLFWSLLFWRRSDWVQAGLSELWDGIRIPFGLFLAAGVVSLMMSKKHLRFFSVFMVFLATSTLFVYLKGAEQMGLWSQRRLVPALALLTVALLPYLIDAGRGFIRLMEGIRLKGTGSVLVIGFLLTAALANVVRWPAPYFTRVEADVLGKVHELKNELGHTLTFFDYHPFSFPFSVDNRTRAFGIGQQSRAYIGPVMDWLRLRLREEPVMIMSAYQNPGIEHETRLSTAGIHSMEFSRVRSASSLPAVRQPVTVTLRELKMEPLGGEEEIIAEKILDGGPLGLRGPWAESRRILEHPTGNTVPADWSREGSGLIGPVPTDTMMVTMTILCSSGREVPQLMRIVPPWGGDDIEVLVNPGVAFYNIDFHARHGQEAERQTGTYRLYARSPYDPAKDGISGFPSDLGILVASVRFERSRVIDF